MTDAPEFTLVVRGPGGHHERLFFHQSSVEIGRFDDNDVSLPKGDVSRRHARLVFQRNRFVVMDRTSATGTYVNDQPVHGPRLVRPGDEIRIGRFVLTLEEGGWKSPRQDSPSSNRNEALVQGEVKRCAQAREFKGLLGLLRRLVDREAAQGEHADWRFVERQYRTALQEASAHRPPASTLAELWGELATVLGQLGRKSEAHEALTRARQLDPATWRRSPSTRAPAAGTRPPPTSIPPAPPVPARQQGNRHDDKG
jgi:hypothetical protein